MAVRSFFSGVEGKSHFEAALNAGATHLLTSYLQFYDKGNLDVVKDRKKKYPSVDYMIDSGAHTFIKKSQKFSHWSMRDFETFVSVYADWLLANKDYIFCAVELDIDYCINVLLGGSASSSLGTATVKAWQDKYFRPLQDKGVEIIYVWHEERGMDGWEDMCQKFAYCGLPGEFSSRPDFNKYLTVARRYSTKVHGFAATKQADFRDWPWFSVDSITWKDSEMYGVLIHWDEHKQLITYDPDKKGREKYKDSFIKHGLDAKGIIADKAYKEVTKYALISMRAMEKFYEDRYSARLYYYDLRLPSPHYIDKLSIREMDVFWKRFRPDTLFSKHQTQASAKKQRYLQALAAVQYGDRSFLVSHGKHRNFLAEYFPSLVKPLILDMAVFQKELASYTAPPNPPAVARDTVALFSDSSNLPKARDDSEFSLEELEYVSQSHLFELENL